MDYVFAFVEFYLAPFIFAVGLIFFVYGVINYFIIGPGFEEERREVGRHYLVWTMCIFLIGLLVYGIASWMLDFTQKLNEQVDTNIERDVDILPVPNVPTVQ